MIDVSVIIVSYNTRELTLATLATLHDQRNFGELAVSQALPGSNFPETEQILHRGIEVIVVDNASTDGSADAICAAFPAVTVARSNVNLGFAPAVNLAAERARGRYLLLLNPDIRPDGPFILELLEFAEKHPSHGIYGGRTMREDGRDFLAGYAFPSIGEYLWFATGLSKLYNPEELPRLDRSRPVHVPALSGCLMLVERELWEALGGFDPRFFMYSEDTDLCWRAAQAGARPVLVPSARVTHLGGRSTSGRALPSAAKVEMLLNGKILFLRKHWPSRRARLGRALILCGVALRALAGSEPWRTAWRSRAAWRDGYADHETSAAPSTH